MTAALSIATASALSLGMSSTAFAEDSPFISNGQLAQSCAMPGVARLTLAGGGGCTGTLIHPQVILYAAHCGRLVAAQFGERGEGPRVTNISKTLVNPAYQKVEDEPIDWAFAVLSSPVQGVPIVPVAYDCELEEHVQVGSPVVMAGYGQGSTGGLHWVRSKIAKLADGWIEAGGETKTACPGDSGGPLLVQLDDGSWRTIGVTSTIWGSCGGSSSFNHWSRVRREMLEWLEAESGIDLTHCYDLDGNIDVTDNCGPYFAGDIESPTGSWSNGCADAKVVDEPKLCIDDAEAPTVEITSPADGDTFTVGDEIEITVDAEDDIELSTVELLIDGEVAETWNESPFVFTLDAENVGTVELVARATDAAGNTADSETVEITIEEESETPDDDDKDDEDDGDSDDKDDDEDDSSSGDDSTEDDEGDDEEDDEDSDDNDDDDKDDDDKDDDKDDDDDDKDDDSKSAGSSGESGGGCSTQGSNPNSMMALIAGLLLLLPRRRRKA